MQQLLDFKPENTESRITKSQSGKTGDQNMKGGSLKKKKGSDADYSEETDSLTE